MKLNSFLLFLAIVLLILIFIYKPGKIEKSEVLRIDTITIIKPVERIVVSKAKPKIIYQRDTIIQTKPFVATLDTIVSKDTIEAEYKFPENIIDLRISRSADTIAIPKIVVLEKKEKNNLLEKGLFFLAGATLGLLLGKTK